MLVKLLAHQIPTYEDVIRQTIEVSIPDCEERIVTDIYKELLLETAQCWISYKDDAFEGVLITRIVRELAVGCHTLRILCIYAPNGTELDSFISGFETLSKFAKGNDCNVVDFYSNEPKILDYARNFSVKRSIYYMQLNIGE